MGKQWPFAGIENNTCLCSAKEPVVFTSNSDCSYPCPGTQLWPATEQQPSCGGVQRISVYDVRSRIIGLNLRNPGPQHVYERMNIEAYLSNGKDIKYKFTSGDGDAVLPRISSTPNMTHVYDSPGTFQVCATKIICELYINVWLFANTDLLCRSK